MSRGNRKFGHEINVIGGNTLIHPFTVKKKETVLFFTFDPSTSAFLLA